MSDQIDEQYTHFDYRMRINQDLLDELVKKEPLDIFKAYYKLRKFDLIKAKDDFYDDKKFKATPADVSSNPIRFRVVKHMFKLLDLWDKRKTYEEALKKIDKADWIGRDIAYVDPTARSHEGSMFEVA